MAKTTFKNIRKLHLLLCFIVCTIVIGFYYVTISAGSQLGSEDPQGLIYEYAVPLIVVVSILIARYLAKKETKKAEMLKSLDQKLKLIQSASIKIWSAFVGSATLCAASFFVTGRFNFVYYSIILAVLLLYVRPIKSKIVKDFKLSDSEADQLEQAL